METIVLAICLISSPHNCKDINIPVTPAEGASIQIPFHCFRQGQIEAKKWISDHPSWRIKKWSCPPNGKLDHKV